MQRPGGENAAEEAEVDSGSGGLVREVWTRFQTDNLGLYAAAISFYALLSTVPLLLMGIAALGFFITPATAQALVLDFFARFIPGAANVRALVESIHIDDAVEGIVRSRGLAALVGFGSLLWASSHVFFHLQTAMNVAWRVPTPRHILTARALSLVSIAAAGGLFLLSLFFTAALRFLRDLSSELPFSLVGEIPWFWEVAGFSATLLLSILTFVFLLRFLPAAYVPWRAAAVAGAGVGVVWEVAKQVFAFYLSRFAMYNKIYGALGGLVGLVLWVNLSALLLLLGAETAAVWTRRHYIGRGAGH